MRRSRKTGCRTVKIRIFMERRVSESVCAFLYLRTFYLSLTVNPLPRRGRFGGQRQKPRKLPAFVFGQGARHAQKTVVDLPAKLRIDLRCFRCRTDGEGVPVVFVGTAGQKTAFGQFAHRLGDDAFVERKTFGHTLFF